VRSNAARAVISRSEEWRRLSNSASRGAIVLASIVVLIVTSGNARPSAHRLDEYLQAARLAIDPDRVQLELDLTPGLALAEAVLNDIDRDHDGSISGEEQRTYGRVVMDALDLAIDGRPVSMQLVTARFPATGAVARGEGTIRLHASAMLPPLSNGVHHLSFRNRHHPDRSVYLANALVPETDAVAITAQRRDGDQRALTIDYVLRDTAGTSGRVWLLGGIVAATLLLVMVMVLRSSRPRHR
jgi:hypothetical protein